MNEITRDATTGPMLRRSLVLLAWLASLTAALVVLVAAGDGALAAPALGSPTTWRAWAAERQPAEAAMAVLRLVGIGLAWYLLAATVLGIGAQLLGGARAVELADVVTLPLVRRIVQVGLGVGMAGAVVAAAGARGPEAPKPAATAADIALAGDDAPAPPVRVRDELPEPRVVETVGVDAPRTWVLAPGDHLWSVSARVLGEALGREPTDAEVHPYWQAVVERNRQRLPLPHEPDLVHPGLTIELPDAVPSRA